MVKKVKVKRVIDGDTFVGGDNKIYRLANVDTPEAGKSGAAIMRDYLDRLIGDDEVSVDQKAIGPYGRSIVNVKKGSKSVNKAVKDMNKKTKNKIQRKRKAAAKKSRR
jgi:endonuclease YncB( thermonuclease family)